MARLEVHSCFTPPLIKPARSETAPYTVDDLEIVPRLTTSVIHEAQREKPRKGVFVVGKAAIDLTATFLPNTPIPEVFDKYGTDKYVVNGETFTTLLGAIDEVNAKLEETVGGNALNMAHRLRPLRDGPIIIDTWANTKYKDLIKTDLAHPGMKPEIQVTESEMQIGLIIPRDSDRSIISHSPTEMPSEFADNIPNAPKPQYAIINSLGGTEWDLSLNAGIDRLTRAKIPYVYTPGSPQLKALVEGSIEEKAAVYNAIENAYALVVNIDELKSLLLGKNMLPAREITHLLQQGLELGAKNILVTDGANGAFGANKETMVKVSAIPVTEVKSTNGAGDAFAAAAVQRLFETNGDMEQSVLWGVASGSFAVEQVGAHENPPSREALEQRLLESSPLTIMLKSSQKESHTIFYGRQAQGPVLLLA